MPKNKGEKQKNRRPRKTVNRDTLAHFFRGFHNCFDEGFFREFRDKESEKRERFLEAYDLTCGNVSASCRVSGIPRRTYYNWLKSKSPEHVEFRRLLAEIIPGQRLGDMAELVLLCHLKMGSLDAAKFVLSKNRFLAGRGYRDKPLETEKADEKELRNTRRYIEKLALENETDYDTELRKYLNEFKEILDKEIYEKLASELKR